jgi:aminoglycoside phosphotransferase (APT) family kinase protein
VDLRRAGKAGGLVSQDEAIAIWERASGLTADRGALHWWTLFNCVKGQGIWVGSAAAFSPAATRRRS